MVSSLPTAKLGKRARCRSMMVSGSTIAVVFERYRYRGGTQSRALRTAVGGGGEQFFWIPF